MGGGTGSRGAPSPICGIPSAPQPAAYRNLSGSPTRLPLPALFQGGVCGVETRTRREEELYNREKPRRTSGDRERQPEGAEGGAKSTRANRLEMLGMGGGFVCTSKRRNSREGGARRSGKRHLGCLALPRSALPPPLPPAGPERMKPREGALIPVTFLLGRQPKPEPGNAEAEHMGPETTAPPSPPGRVGRQLGGWL